jgi:hypothetical protein
MLSERPKTRRPRRELGTFWSKGMKHTPRFGTTGNVTQREAVQIWKMILDLDRSVQFLNCDIRTEEERARISDPSDVAYPILARTLAARRDNLKATVAALEYRLSELDGARTVAEAA